MCPKANASTLRFREYARFINRLKVILDNSTFLNDFEEAYKTDLSYLSAIAGGGGGGSRCDPSAFMLLCYALRSNV